MGKKRRKGRKGRKTSQLEARRCTISTPARVDGQAILPRRGVPSLARWMRGRVAEDGRKLAKMPKRIREAKKADRRRARQGKTPNLETRRKHPVSSYAFPLQGKTVCTSTKRQWSVLGKMR